MASTDLCTYSDVLLNRSLTNKADDTMQQQIEALITAKTSAITSYLNMEQILAKSYTEYYDGSGDRYLFVDNLPINSITSIYDDTDWTWGSDTLLSSSTYRIVDSKYVALNIGYYFTEWEQNIKITYNAGYTTIPADLKQVCIEEVVRTWNEKENIGIATKSDPTGTTTRLEKGFMKQSLQVLNKYKRISVL